MDKSIVLIRMGDLRLHDNPALYTACQNGAILPVFIIDNEDRKLSASAKNWWLHHALLSFQEKLASLKAKLHIRMGDTETILTDIVEETGCTEIFWNRTYEPAVYEKDLKMAKRLDADGMHIQTFEGRLLHSPWVNRKPDGTPYKVFSAFYRAYQKVEVPAPLPSISEIQTVKIDTPSLTAEQLDLLPVHPWAEKLDKYWHISEEAAIKKLEAFANKKLIHYKERSDFPAKEFHSSLSPYIASGLLSVRTIYHYLVAHDIYAEAFVRQLVWRDFSWHLLFHYPEAAEQPWNNKFESFAWNNDIDLLQQWKEGKTGYPIVDAGMRELWETGFMHNRVRMITASFLTKHLLIHWRNGAEWFMDTLVDADLANNQMSWQWVAGSGADAAPYFRIFNPTLQSKKFDEEGVYLKKWLPELRQLPNRYIHEPHKATSAVLEESQVKLGVDYPHPIVDHKSARERALAAYHELSKESNEAK
ncbi:deoxyribodipyrimidine photo-lyase [Bacillus ectoiniformans]|uniref:cryptochrome/photolyase family protein n=1 Tax=Bacillus ectoiniformans TaxID=1494429 RepID=UPI00195CA90E|nr:deoxyribodipyrimidine photo-lyase [Bacillus ectoiniformans]MBM7647645.1 deoxyribodipyrimidine photo-lyase [Bacillus ectoiniformans]